MNRSIAADNRGEAYVARDVHIQRTLRLSFMDQVRGLNVLTDPYTAGRAHGPRFLCGCEVFDQRHGTLNIGIAGSEPAGPLRKFVRKIEQFRIGHGRAACLDRKVRQSSTGGRDYDRVGALFQLRGGMRRQIRPQNFQRIKEPEIRRELAVIRIGIQSAPQHLLGNVRIFSLQKPHRVEYYRVVFSGWSLHRRRAIGSSTAS